MCHLDRPDTSLDYYIGLEKIASSPVAPDYWLDGSSSTYRAYKSGEPDTPAKCFVISAVTDVEMEDRGCLAPQRYICKIGKVIVNHRGRTT